MHYSNDSTNFRNKQYIENMEMEFKNMFRAYHKYISYRKKLLEELNVSQEQRMQIEEIDQRFIKNLKRVNRRVQKNGMEK